MHGHEAAVRLQRAMNDTVGEVGRVAGAEGFDADIHQGARILAGAVSDLCATIVTLAFTGLNDHSSGGI